MAALAALTGLIVSLSIEIIQMFGFGTSDVNDLITNTLGACLGYGVYKLLYKFVPKSLHEKIQIDGSKCFYEPISLWLSALIIMITVQPYVFVHCFR